MVVTTILYLWDTSEIEETPDKRRTIESFSEADCYNYFETRKEDLPRLLHVLRIPYSIVLPNQSHMLGETCMLRALYELVSGNDQYYAVEIFGKDQPTQSRALTWFIDHVFYTLSWVVTNNLDWWYESGLLHRSMEAIKAKCSGNDLFSTCAFIDCNCLECSRPGGGPHAEGPDAERWDPTIQRSFYNGWKSVHGLKHQTVDCAFGMTVDLHGPYSLRRNDLKLLRYSRINRRLRDLQVGADTQLTLYGDSIYPYLSHLRSSIKDL